MIAENRLVVDVEAGRRAFIGALGLGVAGSMLLGGGGAAAQGVTDMAIMNFALNFEYLGAQFYSYATTGKGISASLLTGTGTPGQVTGGAQVKFQSPFVRAYAEQLARDELGHVKAVRTALGANAIAQPAISLGPAFAAAAAAAGIPGFNVFQDDVSFLLGAYVLEDVCVTALHGAAPLLTNPADLDAAAGLLGTEAQQAGMIRVKLYELATAGQPVIFTNTALISALRTKLSDNANPPDDVPIQTNGMASIVNADANSQVFARLPRQVLNIAYGAQNANAGQFFPSGINGTLT